MKLIRGFDPLLTTPCQKFDFTNPPFDPIEFAVELVKFMYENNGIGLAANQVGIPYRIFAMRGEPENYVMFNPIITATSDEKIKLLEGCLSFPNVTCDITRPKNVRVRYTQPNGNTKTEVFHGITARIIQHEIEHLDGKLFFNNLSKYHRDKALKKFTNG